MRKRFSLFICLIFTLAYCPLIFSSGSTPYRNPHFNAPTYKIHPGDSIQRTFSICNQLYICPHQQKAVITSVTSNPELSGMTYTQSNNSVTVLIKTTKSTAENVYTLSLEAENIFGYAENPQYFKVDVHTIQKNIPQIKGVVSLQVGVATHKITPLPLVDYFTVPAGAPAITHYALGKDPLPTGLNFNGTKGNITGTPSESAIGAHTVEIYAINSVGKSEDPLEVPFQIYSNIPPQTKDKIPEYNVMAGQSLSYIHLSSYFSVPKDAPPINEFDVSSGDLPPGISLNPETGVLDGNITLGTSGKYSAEIITKNLAGFSKPQQLTIHVVNEHLPYIKGTIDPIYAVSEKAIQPLELKDYFGVNQGSSSIEHYSWGSEHPVGINLNAKTGELTGKFITQALKNYLFSFYANNAAGQSHQAQSVTYIVYTNAVPEPVGVIPTQKNLVGETFPELNLQQYFHVSTGGAPISGFKITEGQLPKGLTMDSITGKIKGEYALAGTFDVKVLAHNLAGDSQTQPIQFIVSTTDKPVLKQTRVDRFDIMNTDIDPPFDLSIYFMLDKPDASSIDHYSIETGQLPTETQLNDKNGQITGSLHANAVGERLLNISANNLAGASDPLRVDWTIYNTDKPYVVDSFPPIIDILHASLSKDISPYFSVPTNAPPITQYKFTGAIPDGITFDKEKKTLKGKYNKEGKFSIAIVAENQNGDSPYEILNFTIYNNLLPTINGKMDPIKNIVGSTLSPFSVKPYFTFPSGAAPITEYTTQGALPDGITFDEEGGSFAGQFKKSGDYAVDIKAVNEAGPSDSQPLTFKIYSKEKPIVTGEITPFKKLVGEAFPVLDISSYFSIIKGSSPITKYELSDTLPKGITFDKKTTEFTGNFEEAGDFTLNISAVNLAGPSKPLVIQFNVDSKPTVTGKIDPFTALVGDPFPALKVASHFSIEKGSSQITKYELSGRLPKGITYDDKTAIFTGNFASIGDYTLKISAVNNAGKSDPLVVKFTIDSKPTVTGKIDPFKALLGEAFPELNIASHFSIEKGSSQITKYELSGPLPKGITYDDKTAKFKGKFEAIGDYTFNINAVNHVGKSDSLVIKFTIDSKPTVTGEIKPFEKLEGDKFPELNIASHFSVIKGSSQITKYELSGTLPKGITYDDKTATFSGSFKEGSANKYALKITAQNDAGDSASLAVDFTIYTKEKPSPTDESPDQNKDLGDEPSDLKLNTYFNVSKKATPIDSYALDDETEFPLPPGITFNTNGSFTGCYSKSGSYMIKVKAHNLAGWSEEQTIKFSIKPITVKIRCPNTVNDKENKPRKEGQELKRDDYTFTYKMPIWEPNADVYLHDVRIDGDVIRCEYNGYHDLRIIAALETTVKDATLKSDGGEIKDKNFCDTKRYDGDSTGRCYLEKTITEKKCKK